MFLAKKNTRMINEQTGDNDPLLFLQVYSSAGRPVCLWEYNSDLRSLFSKTDNTILHFMRGHDDGQDPPKGEG